MHMWVLLLHSSPGNEAPNFFCWRPKTGVLWGKHKVDFDKYYIVFICLLNKAAFACESPLSSDQIQSTDTCWVRMCFCHACQDLNQSVMQAIAPQIVVPTCRFALQGCTDVFVQLFGYHVETDVRNKRNRHRRTYSCIVAPLCCCLIGEGHQASSIIATMLLEPKQGGPGSVRLRFGGGTVRAVPVERFQRFL